jgi:5-methyltetrahydrofolate--homocysteine methyltransferase
MQEIAYELNFEGARLVRAAAITAENEDGRKRFVAARSGRPTAPPRSRRTSPIRASRDHRSISCARRIAEQVRGLLDGGADLLLIETIFDTLNAKAAIHAILDETEARGIACRS